MATAASAVPGGSVDLALEGCTVIVTGAGSGIGAATARLLGAAGASVVLVGRREAPLWQSADAVEQAGRRTVLVPADLADRTSPARIIAAALAAFGRIDGVVNNAAMFRHRPLAEWEADGFDDQVGDERTGTLLPDPGRAAGAVGTPRSRRWSTSALHPGTMRLSGQSVYGMTKCGAELPDDESLAGELAATGVRVNCIGPGPIDTPIHATWADDLDGPTGGWKSQVPLGRIGVRPRSRAGSRCC